MMPDEIHDYKILDQLGEGGFGKVFLVESVDKHKFALKLISVNKDNKDDAKKQAQLYVALNHPNILKAREFFFFNKEKYLTIILEYCPDGSLCNLIGKSSIDSIRAIIKGIAEGLVYLHEKNVIHRDIKPQNILMLEGIPKITDLGISKIMMNTSGVSGKTCTPFYASPEVLYEEKYEKSADIWSLGIVSLELLLGKRINQMIKGILQPAGREDFPSEVMLSQIKDQELKEIVKKMLIKKAEQRPTAQEVLNLLNGKTTKKQESKNEASSNQSEQQKIKPPNIKVSTQNIDYAFSPEHKHNMITLSNSNTQATHPDRCTKFFLALVDGVVLRKGSFIRFKIRDIGWIVGVGVGLAVRNVVVTNQYKLQKGGEIGRGCFLLFCGGDSYSHNNMEQNSVSTDFKYGVGDVIRVETNEDELLFVNETKGQEYRLKLSLTEDEWKQACFCVELNGEGDSVSIASNQE